jgi:hypothetical protein
MRAKLTVATVVPALIGLGALMGAPAASAASTISLTLSQGDAFAVLGHSCGGIQEHPYATGFSQASGYPEGVVYLKTTCGGSGRGGGYSTTVYTAVATVSWNWFGSTRSYTAGGSGGSEGFEATDAYGDRLYNTATAAYLETTNPPLVPPAPPTGVTAAFSPIEVGESVVLRFQVSWTPASETAQLITSSTVTATPVEGTAPVVTATVAGGGSYAVLEPLQPSTTYRITVTNSDQEGTSQPSEPIEARALSEEERQHEEESQAPGPPEFGRCVKVPLEGGSYHGGFTSSTCKLASLSGTGQYEWEPGVSKQAFSELIKPLTSVVLQTGDGAKLTCTGQSGSGRITSPKAVAEVQMTFTGCGYEGGPCTTPGLGEGTLRTSQLEGALAMEVRFREGKEIRKIYLGLRDAHGQPFLEYECAIGGLTQLTGGVFVPVPANKMASSRALVYAQKEGVQKPQGLFEGPEMFLVDQAREGVGLALHTTLTTEEPVEINAFA